MHALRAIETESYAKVTPPSSFGAPPKLEWLPIKSLRIDPAYQREITLVGRKNIRRIVENFDWSMFAPVIVAPAGSNLYAIVDGQHRATAAALAGIERVPCSIIDGNRIAQAKAFRSINGNVTKLSSIQIHHAAVAAGEEKAIGVERVCGKAGVVALRYPKPWNTIGPGETMAVQTVARCIAKFGEETTTIALKALRETGDGNAGNFKGPIIFGITEVLADHKEWRDAGAELHAAFDLIDFGAMLEEASSIAARTRGSSATDQFESRLVAALEHHFKRKVA